MKKIIKNIILTLLCGAVLFSASGCGQTAEVTGHKQFFCMDTVMTLEAYGDKGSAAVDTATGVITDLANELDPQSESSEVYKMNNAGGVPVTVSDDIVTMLSTAYKVYGQTDGALDLTVYSLSVLWGFIDLDNGGAGHERAMRGSNLRYDLELPFEEAVFGTTREIAYSRNDTCKTCHDHFKAR